MNWHDIYILVEMASGLLVLWVATYLFSKNTLNILSWKGFIFLFSLSFVLLIDPILLDTRSIEEYILWQKIGDWPLYFMPVFCFHSALLITKKNKKFKNILIASYLISAIIYILDINKGLILNELVLRYDEFRRFDGFEPGVLLIPVITYTTVLLIVSGLIIARSTKKSLIEEKRLLYPVLGSWVFAIASAFVGLSFYIKIGFANEALGILLVIGSLLFSYSIVRYHLFVHTEELIFDKSFYLSSLFVIFLIIIYTIPIYLLKIQLSFEIQVFLIVLMMLVIISHGFYDRVTTFLNDILYNPNKGISVVTDDAVSKTIRDFNDYSKLENSRLMNLILVKNRKNNQAPIDRLRGVVEEAIEYFRPNQENIHRRTKQSLKYHMLKMIAYDQAEEGQILWELGFEDYPIRIMSNESGHRPPLFKSTAPSDYTYTSRNAYLALKKEAIHNVTWRISYLEKLSKKKMI